MSDPINTWILPIFTGRKGDPWEPLEFAGTGFVLGAPTRGHDIFITCWHCVKGDLDSDHEYAAVFQRGIGGPRHAIPLRGLERDKNDSDLATAIAVGLPRSPLRLGKHLTEVMDRVRTYGYPLTRPQRREDGVWTFELNERYLEGYVTRIINFDRLGWGLTPSFELDMKTPAGLSGAPLFSANYGTVEGVIYGENEVATIAEFESIEPVTRERRPEVQRIVRFGLAHFTPTLHALEGQATEGMTLANYALFKEMMG
jgi:Trypsin-like peptidase domain